MACRVPIWAGALRVPYAAASEARKASSICLFRGCDARSRVVLLQRRQFSRSRGNEAAEFETLDVVCGSSGKITVELYNPQALRDPSAPLILYLPPTGSHLRDTHPSIPRLLLAQKDTALAQINYRWNIPLATTKSSSPHNSPPASSSHLQSLSPKAYPFPVPLHDTLHALDHLTHHLKKYSQPTTPPLSPYAAISSPKDKIQRPLLIYGSFLGGTLATSFALTESHASRSYPYKVIGLVAQNAVFDWSEVAATKPPSTKPSSLPPSTSIPGNQNQEALNTSRHWSSEPWTSQTLHALKTTLFSSPQWAFDPFASPLLFFRTSGYSIPRRWPGTRVEKPEEKPFITSIISDSEDAVVSSTATSDYNSTPGESGLGKENETGEELKEEEEEEGEIGRRYPLKFPPSRSYTNPEADLELPRALFITTTSTPSSISASTEPLPSTLHSARSTSTKSSRSKHTKSASKPTPKLGPTPYLQALELESRMHRSIEQQESRRNAQWEEWGNEQNDSSGDNESPEKNKHAYADGTGERVKLLNIDSGIGFDSGGNSYDGHDSPDGESESESEIEIRNWIEDVIG